MRIPFITNWVQRRKLRAEVSRLALHAFYHSLDEIDALEALLEAERRKAMEAEVQARVTAQTHRALNCAVAQFADAFDNSLTALHQADGLSYGEVSALSALLAAAGRPDAGELWMKHYEMGKEPDESENSDDIEEAEVIGA
ncbi:hypothetical protein DEJ47_24690 [Streptomyces venezuelae]|uniref:Uncharacterized protein n=2 Tax=Streptomyces venezuelae TaxID=54571 RepID=A0A5P2BFC1_STRVZ|nr:hypothetical protein DEJ47_24690 [Streptomyces venezuelae]